MHVFLLVGGKLFIGFLALIFVINISGKGNLAPSTASDAVQNYVLGGIIGGFIYNNDIHILEYLAILFIWCGLVLLLRYVKVHNVRVKQILDGIALIVVEDGNILYENPRFPLITDGQLQKNILHVIGKDIDWVKKEVERQGYSSIHAVYLGEYRDGNLYCYPRKS